MSMNIIGDLAKSVTGSNISDLGNNLIVGYKFYVFIGPIGLGFNRVSGIERTYNYQPLQVGGVNDKLKLLRRPIEQASTLILEDGGMQISAAKMKLYFEGGPRDILILLCTSSGKIKDVIVISEAVISKVNISTLDAQDSRLIVNTIEMTYTNFTRMGM